MESNQKLDVVYILSEKSSGSSFLFRSLNDALGITSYPTTKHFESETLFWTKAASLLGRPQLNMLASDVPYEKETARTELAGFLANNLSTEIKFNTDEELVFDGWYELIKQFGPVFIEKSPHHLLQWNALALMLEFEQRFSDKVNCHYVCIVRNPRDVFLSQFRRWNVNLKQLENQWLITYMNWERFREASFSTSNKIFTRYEDLVADRQSVISKICEVIGVSSKLKGEEKVRKSKSSKKSKSFGYKFSPSVICLSKSMGYSQSDLKHTDSFKWTWYELYIKYLYSPAKSFYRLVKK
ncbi:sulfotransferase [uncultured Alteromonas sp.]|uniref:sulfotransferase family protein n=1 Tax=uncultured Alteromonas sp. TaxID=179113 RepID=UPI0030D6F7AA